MADTKNGVYDKYAVTRADGKPVGRCLVIEIDKDPLAYRILEFCGAIYWMSRRKFAKDLWDMADKIREEKELPK